MFWVIFDTSTKRDYYRDVHNLLALPPKATIRYDYNQMHVSAAAIEEAKKSSFSTKVLVAYAQTKNFKKGHAAPVGPIANEGGFWVATRIADLKYLGFSGNRYVFDLELLGYPTPNDDAFRAIIESLLAKQETPFIKWVAVSDLDAQFDALVDDKTAGNWASVINKLGNFPSQFSGDCFWRVANIAAGVRRVAVQPELHEIRSDGGNKSGIEAIYPANELARIALQVESRIPEAVGSIDTKEPEAPRIVALQTAADGPLKGLNGKQQQLRRYTSEWIEVEVESSDRIDAQLSELTFKTGPAAGTYPIGPEFTLRFQIAKRPGSGHLAILLAIAALVCGVSGPAIFKDHAEWAILLLVGGVLLGIGAYYVWTGRVKLPGAK
jgi:hypothetical protein